LAAAVFTRDVDRAGRVSRQINAGTVWTDTWFAMNAGFATAGDPGLSPRAWHWCAVHRHANRRPPGL
jgi:acyl-CoA reductase-like NAD-dependent aldehyde dehydrogenase